MSMDFVARPDVAVVVAGDDFRRIMDVEYGKVFPVKENELLPKRYSAQCVL